MELKRKDDGVTVVRDDGSELLLREIIGIGRNYEEHAREQNAAVPPLPLYFTKSLRALTLHQSPIIVPKICQDRPQTDFEAELAVILDRDARDVAEENALDYVLGYTCANDVSARWWQKEGGQGQFFRGKSFDTFAPLGPVVASAAAIGDPQKLKIECRVDGRTMQSASTADMIYSVKRLIADLSQGITLPAGTVILTGTPGGVGFTRKPPVFLEHGTVVEVEIEKIGILQNAVVFEGRDLGYPKDILDADYWRKRWQEGRTGFHQDAPNQRLTTHFERFGVRNGSRVFVPLCGKTVDMKWLADRGLKVVGVDCAEKAAAEFFAESGMRSQRIDDGFFILWRSNDVQIFVGDIFDTSTSVIGIVDAVWDRASLVALPPVDRRRYAAKLAELLATNARVLLVTFEYDQSLAEGPPFSVGETEVRELFSSAFSVELLERAGDPETGATLKSRGVDRTFESTYLLIKK